MLEQFVNVMPGTLGAALVVMSASVMLGAGLLAGFASFMPHRTMWWMAFG